MHAPIIIALLFLLLAGLQMNLSLTKRVAGHLNVAPASTLDLLLDRPASPPQVVPIPATVIQTPPGAMSAATTSAFESGPSDFMTHARRMDARAGTPAAKAEALIMNTDQAQRKLRSTLMRGS